MKLFNNRVNVQFGIALAMISALAISSCEDKNSEDTVPAGPLVGTWVLSNLDISGCVDPEEDGAAAVTCTGVNCSKIKMSRDGVFTVDMILAGTPYVDAGTYLVMGDVIEICVEGGTSCSNVEYELSDDKKTLYFTELDGDSGCTTVATYTKL